MSSTTVNPYQLFSPLAVPEQVTELVSDSVSFFLPEPQNLPFVDPTAFVSPSQSTGGVEGNSQRWMRIEDLLRVLFEAELDELQRRLDELAELQPDWDSFGSEPPSPIALTMSRVLMRNIAAALRTEGVEQALPFFVGPISGGGVQVEWRGPSNSIEVEVSADGGFDCLIARGTGSQRKFEERQEVSLPEIEELISSVVR